MERRKLTARRTDLPSARRCRMRAAAVALVAAVGVALGGCALHLGRVDLNRPLSAEGYEGVALGSDTRRDVLARLGPPDGLFYTPLELVFDYRASRHRATDLELFVPTDLLPGPVNPLSILSMQRFFFDPFVEPQETSESTLESAGRRGAEFALGLVPFVSGEEVLVVNGRQIRTDQLRIVFDRESLVAIRKSLRLASGSYDQDSLGDRILLQSH